MLSKKSPKRNGQGLQFIMSNDDIADYGRYAWVMIAKRVADDTWSYHIALLSTNCDGPTTVTNITLNASQ